MVGLSDDGNRERERENVVFDVMMFVESREQENIECLQYDLIDYHVLMLFHFYKKM